eukprot:scaffold7729_cov471-Prasinococcus_capsulatus_cf.AAC.2
MLQVLCLAATVALKGLPFLLQSLVVHGAAVGVVTISEASPLFDHVPAGTTIYSLGGASVCPTHTFSDYLQCTLSPDSPLRRLRSLGYCIRSSGSPLDAPGSACAAFDGQQHPSASVCDHPGEMCWEHVSASVIQGEEEPRCFGAVSLLSSAVSIGMQGAQDVHALKLVQSSCLTYMRYPMQTNGAKTIAAVRLFKPCV